LSRSAIRFDSIRRETNYSGMTAKPASGLFLGVCAAILFAMVVVSGIGAKYPADWRLENLLVVAAVIYLVATRHRLPLSRGSYVLILVFLGFHEIGAHWTFAEVPYDDAARRWFGFSLNERLGWERNHYDRLVHFLYGCLLTRPMRETLGGSLCLHGPKAAVVTWIFMLATSSLYELLEWAAALVFGGDLGIAYLGTQGDVWDAHKDTLFAVGGAALALTIPFLSGASS
jgi:putative membrane protein